MGCSSTRIAKRNRRVCIGDLRDRIVLQGRSILPPTFDGGGEFGEQFAVDEEVWAMVETTTGETLFDGANVERVVTHKIYVRYDESLTEETWVLFQGKRMDVINVEDLEERHEFLLLRCTDRGSDEVEASRA